MKRKTLILSLFIGACISAGAHSFNPDTLITRYALFSEYLAPEKLYLHLDRTAYCAGETIWFSGWLRNASPATIYNESNFIYVELLDPDGNIEKRVKVKRDGASFPGHIFLNDDTTPGRYTIRAYTRAQLDFSPEHHFNQQITIIGGKNEKVRDKGGKTDVSFYPEGGRFFAEMPARLGFKVMDASGKSVNTAGRIIDGKGETVVQISTDFDGMGSFRFLPLAGEKYFCELSSGDRFELPPAASEGASISIQKLSSRWLINAVGISGGPYSLLIRDIVQIRHLADIEADCEMKSFFLPDDVITGGINHLLLVNQEGSIVAERLFFKYSEDIVRAETSFSEGDTSTRMPVTMAIDLSEATDATCSVSILRSTLAECRQDDGIDSFMFLTSELRGHINEPRHYFDPEVPQRIKNRDMDLLMMIQGWTYYDLAKIADPKATLTDEKSHHFREKMQEIRGRVTRALSSKTPTKFLLAFMIPSMGRTTITPVEEGSTFIIDSLDFEEGTGMIIKIQRMGKGFDFEPSWDGDEFAPKNSYSPAPGLAGSVAEAPVVNYSDPADTLKAAIITADVSSTYLGISGQDVPKAELKSLQFMTLVDYVTMKTSFRFDGQTMSSMRTNLFNIGEGEEESPSTGGIGEERNWDESPVQLVVNGSIASWEAFADLTLGEIKNITISKQPDVIYRATQGVVAIDLDDGANVTQKGNDDISLVYFTPLGYQAPQQFYSPRYDRGECSSDPDLRNTIFWAPSVKVKKGHAEITFCTTDEDIWPLVVQVEGMTSDGKPFSHKK